MNVSGGGVFAFTVVEAALVASGLDVGFCVTFAADVEVDHPPERLQIIELRFRPFSQLDSQSLPF